MKKKIFSLLALVITVTTASAIDSPSYNLTVGENAQGTEKFYVAETEVTKAPEGATVTIKITPNTGWSVGGLQGLWYAAIAKAPRRAQTGVDLLKDFELTKLLGQDNTWSFVMQRANAEISVTYKKLLTNSDITVQDITALTYTGVAQEPTVTVKDGTAVLVKDVDYTVAYSNNVNAGTATVTCTGQGNYSGQAQKTFTINPAKLTSVTLAQTEFMFNLYDPQPQTAEIDVVKAGDLIVPVEGYDVEGNTQTDVNTYTVKVTGKTNFTGTVTADFVIKDTEVPGTAAETESGEEVDDVTMVLTVADRTEQTLNIENISEGSTSTEGIVVEIPATVNGWTVTSVSANAMANLSNVTDIYLPDTEETPIEVADNALQTADGMATVHAPLQLLDNYAGMLPGHVAEKKVVTEVTQTAKRFWTFSCGVDVELPSGVTANIVKGNSPSKVTSEPIKGNVVKANNGVMLEGEQGVEYTLTAMAATVIGNDYEGNMLEPVLTTKHYGYNQGYYILKDGQFRPIANDAAEIPSCKAVLYMPGATKGVIDIIDGETTGVSEELRVKSEKFATATWYDLNGRKLQKAPTTKGLYILNGKKVVVK